MDTSDDITRISLHAGKIARVVGSRSSLVRVCFLMAVASSATSYGRTSILVKTWAALQTMVKGAVSGIGMHGMADGGVGGNGMYGMANGEVGGVGGNGGKVGGMKNRKVGEIGTMG